MAKSRRATGKRLEGKFTGEDEQLIVDEREFIIKEAAIKDDFCIYTYERLKGIGKGDIHSVSGAALVHEDMKTAMEKLHVHLALIDDAFKPSRVKKKESTIEEFQSEDVVEIYHVTGFKIKGKTDDEKVMLIGSKHVNIGGRIEIKTPTIHLLNGHYKFYNELRVTLDEIRKEVEEYILNGKCTPAQEEEDKGQTSMQFEQPELIDNGGITDEQLTGAKV